MKELIPARIAALQSKLKELNLDAAMIYDRENLIYFAGIDDLEGGALAVPAEGEPELFCLWMEAKHVREVSGIEKVTPYMFPSNNQSTMMGAWLKEKGWKAPKLGFTRYFISLKDFQCLQSAAPDMQVCDIAIPCYEIRSIKAPAEIERMRVAGRALAAGMEAAIACVKPGIMETEVLAEAEYAMAKAGSMGSPFRMQVLTHKRQLDIHPYASRTPLEDNAPVVIHLGASCDGYVAKMCRTVFLGKPKEESVRIYEVLKEAQKVAVEALHPGVTCGEIYDKTTAYVEAQGFGKNWVMEHIGYGVGIRQSEFYPIIAKGSATVLQANMVVDLLLPTIYIPGVGGPRITDTILMKEDGVEFLTDFPAGPVCK
ncbi:Xaa-Pro aminopeptidase [Oscillibacter sp. PC13]|jgi:Xaa-Pro dipeptidase|uniref:M24 family metallopeptidase n=1 Tax=Oscillibacter sp. PC13 TaxID=1855299 RepID=UPI0008E51009|nr:Xaa-Pro peptidase family protein [Oscillibacter sp. PC13]SFP58775.1 Xaa-Pro aminopeptidase [Oscillibacter sp. PC13]